MTEKTPAPKKKQKKTPGDLAYYLTMFKLKGHETWRADLKGNATAFDDLMDPVAKGRITERKTFRIDRKTGEVVLQK